MTAKEKASELVFDKFLEEVYAMRTNKEKTASWAILTPEEANNIAKQCALICVDEILKSNNEITKMYNSNNLIDSDIDAQVLSYWNEVKEEINKL